MTHSYIELRHDDEDAFAAQLCSTLDQLQRNKAKVVNTAMSITYASDGSLVRIAQILVEESEQQSDRKPRRLVGV